MIVEESLSGSLVFYDYIGTDLNARTTRVICCVELVRRIG